MELNEVIRQARPFATHGRGGIPETWGGFRATLARHAEAARPVVILCPVCFETEARRNRGMASMNTQRVELGWVQIRWSEDPAVKPADLPTGNLWYGRCVSCGWLLACSDLIPPERFGGEGPPLAQAPIPAEAITC